ncbi:uncharacterized protein EV154DRAFT_491972, partial [Mucor mucedo]|uniref:uncharacterized protein n=1 Tax=Mucor mucedo TaxID=29922 RepID=UPI00221F5D92
MKFVSFHFLILLRGLSKKGKNVMKYLTGFFFILQKKKMFQQRRLRREKNSFFGQRSEQIKSQERRTERFRQHRPPFM